MNAPLVDAAVLEKTRGWRPYVEAKLGFRNHWYPAVFASQVKEGEPVEVELLGESILLNRIDGCVLALRNRCLHRGVKFSKRAGVLQERHDHVLVSRLHLRLEGRPCHRHHHQPVERTDRQGTAAHLRGARGARAWCSCSSAMASRRR